MKTNKVCRVCGEVLNDENSTSLNIKHHLYICKSCETERVGLWHKANPEKARASCIRCRRKQGVRPFSDNRECSKFLGVHVAEQVLSHVFKDVKVMPFDNLGYDFICNKGKKIDVKSACLNKHGAWAFNINHNLIADNFLCLALDNREDLNPLYVWLIPQNIVKHLRMASVRPGTVQKWDEYILDISKVSTCCDVMKAR